VGLGYVRTEPGDAAKQYGWIVDIDPGPYAPSPPVFSVRPADSSLPRLDGLEMRDGMFFAGTLGDAAAAYYHGPAEAGSRLALAFDVNRPIRLRLVVHPEGGDIDVVLREESGRLVDFSNYRHIATEVLETEVRPGRYRVEMLVNDAVSGFDVSLAGADGGGFPQSIAGPTSLELRRDIAVVLEGSGYFAGSEIDISVSPETIRAVTAAQSAAGHVAGGVIDQDTWDQIVSR
jgi:hypothetical protein